MTMISRGDSPKQGMLAKGPGPACGLAPLGLANLELKCGNCPLGQAIFLLIYFYKLLRG